MVLSTLNLHGLDLLIAMHLTGLNSECEPEVSEAEWGKGF